jgi:hypothetical protein
LELRPFLFREREEIPNMKKYFAFAALTVVAQALGGCSSCSKEDEPLVESPPPQAVESATTGGSLLVGPKMKAPALKGILHHADGGMTK